ncbi:MAG: MFS transporter [Chloroflexi bacterium]|nr:MFS transporter [Chloroflexota bacterium]
MVRASHPVRSQRKVFYGWWIVFASGVSNFYTSGVFWYGFTAFFNPIIHEFGWSRAVTSVAFSLQRTETGMAAPFIGFLIDRFGPRRTMLVGVATIGLGFLALAATQNLVTFFLGFIILALGLSLGAYLVTTTTIGNWFRRKRGRAMGLASIGSGLGAVLVPAIVFLIAHFGWRWALVAVGLGSWALGFPCALVLRGAPEAYGLTPDGDDPRVAGNTPGVAAARNPETDEVDVPMRAVLRSPTFWLLALALGLAGALSSGIFVHQGPALESLGLSPKGAGIAVMLVGFASLAGRWLGGVLADTIDQRLVVAGSSAMQVLGGVALALGGNLWMVVAYVVLFSLGFGASVPSRTAILAEYFGRRSFGSVLGWITTMGVLWSVLAPVFIGWMVDMTQSYRWALLVLSLIVFLSVPLTMIIRPPAHATGGSRQGRRP